MIQLVFIDLHSSEYGQEFNYYLFAVKLVRCVGSCNTLNDLSNKVWIPNKTKYLKDLKDLAIITDDSAITCDKVIGWYDEKTKTIPTNFKEKKAVCKTQTFYVLLVFLLITKALLLFDFAIW